MTRTMTNPYDGNDLVSQPLAERLAKLGVKQSYHPLAVYANSESTLIVLESNFNGRWHCFDLEGRTGFWFTEDTLRQRWTWLPRRIDCECLLAEIGYVFQELRSLSDGYVFETAYLKRKNATVAYGDTAAEAVGNALATALEQA